MTPQRILIVGDEPLACAALAQLLRRRGYESRTASDGFRALGTLQSWPCQLMITDLCLPVMNGLELIRKAKERQPGLHTAMMTGHSTVESAVEAMKLGALGYLTQPVEPGVVEAEVARWLEEPTRSIKPQLELLDLASLVLDGLAMRPLLRRIARVARSDATVLLTGESGTGKNQLARLMHRNSHRKEAPFVVVQCGSLARTLLESELFGHERGAFTGAMKQRMGRFEEADGGTLLLDEIGDIGPELQVKLLRFLQEQEFERVGGSQTIHVSVRVIAATNQDLPAEVAAGRFREDLWFRLNVVHLDVPPLRARREAITPMVRHFSDQVAMEYGLQLPEIPEEVLERLKAYDWPGNVRELKHVMEQAMLMTPPGAPLALATDFGEHPFELHDGIRIPGSTLEQIERFAILKTYQATGSTSETARILGISRRKVQYRLKAYNGP